MVMAETEGLILDKLKDVLLKEISNVTSELKDLKQFFRKFDSHSTQIETQVNVYEKTTSKLQKGWNRPFCAGEHCLECPLLWGNFSIFLKHNTRSWRGEGLNTGMVEGTRGVLRVHRVGSAILAWAWALPTQD